MFAHMSGRQLAGWGYGIFWLGLLVELVNAIVSALNPHADTSPVYWIGLAISLSLAGFGIRMLTQIRHRPW